MTACRVQCSTERLVHNASELTQHDIIVLLHVLAVDMYLPSHKDKDIHCN